METDQERTEGAGPVSLSDLPPGILDETKPRPRFRKETPEIGRLTMLGQVSFQSPAHPPAKMSFRYGEDVTGEMEQPLIRTLKIGGGWQKLDLAWLADEPILLLAVKNNETKTEEDDPRTITLGVELEPHPIVPVTHIPPNLGLPLRPVANVTYYLTAKDSKKPIKATLVVVPRSQGSGN